MQGMIYSVRGAARLMGAEDVMGDMIEYVDDILVMDEGPHQYDCRLGIHDLGVTRTGVQITQNEIRASIAEIHPDKLNDLLGNRPTLIFAYQTHDKTLRAYIFSQVQLMPIEMPTGFVKVGEGRSTPISWRYFNGYRILECRDV